MRFIGDIHGKFDEYVNVASSANRSIQVGDFGIGFINDRNEDINNFHASGNHRFIRGNHDDPTMCKNDMVGYIHDGTVENGMMFVGGAWSIDKHYRTENIDWWADEECSYDELSNFVDAYIHIKPKIMITHDGPNIITKELAVPYGRANTKTGQALQSMFEIHQPKIWIFGHWHMNVDVQIGDTRFICLAELAHIDIDVEKV